MSATPEQVQAARAARVRERLEGERRRWRRAEELAEARGEPKRYPEPVGLLRVEERAERGAGG